MGRRGWVAALAAMVAGIVLALAGAGDAAAKTTWLCRPGIANNPCTPGLSTTAFTPTGTEIGPVTGAAVKAEKDPPIDCFYVYPTVSGQPGPQATLAKDPEVRSIALFQAARFSQLCHVYAPVYRQLTLSGISAPDAGVFDTATEDVEAAWKEYLRRFNKGRPVVLIGHSQGSYHLTRLIQRQIDRKPAARELLLSALLLGGNVTVRKGSDVGGSFRNVPACRRNGQIGCVIAFSTFDAPVPADAKFGRVSGRGLGGDAAKDEVLCTNPAALAGGSAPLDTIFPSEPFAPGTAISLGIGILGVPLPTASTTWIDVPGGYEGACSDGDGADVLQITPRNGAPTPKPSPDPTWGLHLMDANVALGNLLTVVRRQVRAGVGRGSASPVAGKRRRATQPAAPRG